MVLLRKDLFVLKRLAPCVCGLLFLAGCASPYRNLPRGSAALPVNSTPLVVSMPLEDYRIGPRDALAVRVAGEPSLSVDDITVSPDGVIGLPMIGQLRVAGMTANELAAMIDKRLRDGRFLRSAQASVSVLRAVNYSYTLDGAVAKPGVFEIPGQLTLARALAIGGGAAQYGKVSEVVVVRELQGTRHVARFNINEIRAGRQPDLQIRQGDIVIVGTDNFQRIFNTVLGNLPAAAAIFVALRKN